MTLYALYTLPLSFFAVCLCETFLFIFDSHVSMPTHCFKFIIQGGAINFFAHTHTLLLLPTRTHFATIYLDYFEIQDFETRNKNKTMSQHGSIEAFRFTGPLGQGGFGCVVKAINDDAVSPEDKVVAIKVEELTSKYPQLEHERSVYEALLKNVRGAPPGISPIYCYHVNIYRRMLVMKRLGPTIFTLFSQKFQGKMPRRVVVQIALDMIESLQYVHNKGFVHRDLKPENMMVSHPDDHFRLGARLDERVYLVDFGCSGSYLEYNNNTNKHVSCIQQDNSLVGTPRYASINTHMGISLSRRDDMESLAYVLLLLIKGTLPWMGMPHAGSKDQAGRIQWLEEVRQAKISTSAETLCSNIPDFEWQEYLTSVLKLRYVETPNYAKYKSLFQSYADRLDAANETLPDLWWVLDVEKTQARRTRNEKRIRKSVAKSSTIVPAVSQLQSQSQLELQTQSQSQQQQHKKAHPNCTMHDEQYGDRDRDHDCDADGDPSSDRSSSSSSSSLSSHSSWSQSSDVSHEDTDFVLGPVQLIRRPSNTHANTNTNSLSILKAQVAHVSH